MNSKFFHLAFIFDSFIFYFPKVPLRLVISDVSSFITHLSMYIFYFSNILDIFTL